MLTKVISFEKHLRQNCQIKGGGGGTGGKERSKRESQRAREGSGELGCEEKMRTR